MKIEELIFNGKQSIGRSRILALFFFLILPGSISWFKFDWAHLTPGIGLLPCVLGSLSIVAMAVLLFRYKPKSKHEGSVHPITWRHIIVSWTCLISLVIALLLWFKYGMRWV
jgi:multisubunit Na+/H+ antiporter MnhB subunit